MPRKVLGGPVILPSCKEVSAAAARGDLSFGGRLHLLICAGCRRFRRQLALIAEALRTSVFPGPEPARAAALEKKILDRLRGL